MEVASRRVKTQGKPRRRLEVKAFRPSPCGGKVVDSSCSSPAQGFPHASAVFPQKAGGGGFNQEKAKPCMEKVVFHPQGRMLKPPTFKFGHCPFRLKGAAHLHKMGTGKPERGREGFPVPEWTAGDDGRKAEDAPPCGPDDDGRIKPSSLHLDRNGRKIPRTERLKKGTGAKPPPRKRSCQPVHFAGLLLFFAALELLSLLFRSAIFASLALR